MEPSIPKKIDHRIEELLAGQDISSLQKAYKTLSNRYHKAQKGGDPIAGYASSAETLAYIAARLPATYAVISRCLQELDDAYSPESILDLGSGPGTASLACLERYPGVRPTLVEANRDSLSLAKFLLADCSEATYHAQDLLNFLKESPSLSHDFVIASYIFGEVKPKEQLSILDNAIRVARDYFLLILPGTPRDFEILRTLRSHIINLAKDNEYPLRITAPCPHAFACPMRVKTDWCHFSVRLPRSAWHRRLKDADLSYEDEKYSYLLVAKDEKPPIMMDQKEIYQGRIVKNPQHRSGHGHLDICTSQGTLSRMNYSRSKSANYKYLKSLQWGDEIFDSHSSDE